jgi:hypothetical protein
MKTYGQAIRYVADEVFNSYMSGSNQPWHDVDFNLIAFIYGDTARNVEADAEIVYNKICADFYESRKQNV